MLIPKITIHSENVFPSSGTSSYPYPSLSRQRREPFTSVTLAVLLAIGAAAGTSAGIYSLVSSQSNFRTLTQAVERDMDEIKHSLQFLTDTVSSLADVVLQNRRGLDLALMKEGGVCVALREQCCVFKDKTGLVRDSVQRIGKGIEDFQKRFDQEQSWYQGWFPSSPWLNTLVPTILGPLISLMLLLSFGPWAFRKLTSFF